MATDTGCPSCASAAVHNVGRNACGEWKCSSCGHAFSDFASAPETTVHAVKDDEYIAPRPRRMSAAEEYARYYSAPGRW